MIPEVLTGPNLPGIDDHRAHISNPTTTAIIQSHQMGGGLPRITVHLLRREDCASIARYAKFQDLLNLTLTSPDLRATFFRSVRKLCLKRTDKEEEGKTAGGRHRHDNYYNYNQSYEHKRHSHHHPTSSSNIIGDDDDRSSQEVISLLSRCNQLETLMVRDSRATVGMVESSIRGHLKYLRYEVFLSRHACPLVTAAVVVGIGGISMV